MSASTTSNATTTHLYVLLDRSGSMQSLHAEVVSGFNAFLADQLADGPDARMTLVQFDSAEPAEVLVDAKRLNKVAPLGPDDYAPRGTTPLLDATGLIIERADARVAKRVAAGKKAEQILVMTMTDGQENASHRFDLPTIRRLVEERQGQGWTFAFLSADLSAYGDAMAMGYDERSIQQYRHSPDGHQSAMASMSRAVRSKRDYARSGADYDRADFFEGVKEAEEPPAP